MWEAAAERGLRLQEGTPFFSTPGNWTQGTWGSGSPQRVFNDGHRSLLPHGDS